MTEVSQPERLTLAADFDDATLSQWRDRVAGVLRKTGALGADDDVPAPERLLATTTFDGIELLPLYTAEDAADLPPAGFPGLAPFVRGTRPEGAVATGWDTRVHHAGADPVATADAVLTDLENGANSVWLRVGGTALPVDALPGVLGGVYADLAPVVLDPGAEYAAAAEQLLGVFAEKSIAPSEAIGVLGADPIGLHARTGQRHDVDPAAELAARISASHPKLRTIVVDALPYHDAGGSDAQELAASIATGVAYLRALTAHGLGVADAAAQLEFRYAATAEQFLTTAKLRAARRLWARVCEASGVADADAARAAQRQHAVTSSAMLSTRDPWVNMLRGTLACFGAAAGGADAITVQPFDAAIGVSDAFARRIARNTSSILLSESKVAGVIDPAGGSWYVETLTDELAQAAWREFQAIEAAGGIDAELASGAIAERLDTTRRAREKRIATRQDPLTGVSEFPTFDEQPLRREPLPPDDRTSGGLPRIRYAQPYERLRDRADAHLAEHGKRPKVFLATLGPIAAHTARATFAANLFAAGGIEPVNPGATETVADVLGAFVGSHTAVACLCGTDMAYAEQADEVTAALRKAGAKAVLLAGKPTDAYEGVTGFVHKGCDVPEVLATTLDTLGVSEQ
ncbi:MAG: methylmalonyl-CoA mutase [Actinophytocola sp.]|nr:methylmalonyl-CoA mutase [Actinophytocola sp.]